MKGTMSKLVRLARAVRRQIAPRDYAATFRAEGLADSEQLDLANYGDRVEIAN